MSSDDVKAAAEPTDTAAPASGTSTSLEAPDAQEAPEDLEASESPEAPETAADDAAEGPAASAAPAGRAPGKRVKPRRMRDMAMSLAVLLVPLGIFLWAWDWAAEDRQVSVVDPSEDYMAAEGLGIEVVRPELSEEWKPISSVLAADAEAVTLRTGWYSPDGYGLQLVQTTGPVDDVDEELTGSSESIEAAGLEWDAYDTAEGEAWVTVLDASTVVLTAEQDAIGELPELAEGVATALPE
ncbi:DUF4245 family protein [Glycomyces arizonensis]|uniref:DUF4245 family protein n=1 Tax=Glycomyces arizonensis TaxID=256035 RepID=UPI00047DB8CC|nr:DUF4245 family protein [Glycomyces arizonensis]